MGYRVGLGSLTLVVALAGGPARGDDVEVIKAPGVRDTNPPPDLEAVARTIIDRTNAFRKEEGRGPTRADDKLAAAAKAFAGYMARTGRYGHTADGREPSDRAKKHGYEYCLVLENIAYAFNSEGFTVDALAGQFTDGWKKSPGHRRNMLDPDVTDTAVAVARSEETGHYFAVQLFGRPKSAAVEFSVRNRAGEAFEYSVGDRRYTLEPRYTRTHAACRPPEVTFHWPGEGVKPAALKPAGGATLVVTREQGAWAVEAK